MLENIAVFINAFRNTVWITLRGRLKLLGENFFPDFFVISY